MRILVLAIATLLVATAGLVVDGALEVRLDIEYDDRAGEDVQCEGVRMTHRDCALRVLVQQEPIYRRKLIVSPLAVQFGALYLISGLGGGIIASWLRLVGLRQPIADVKIECLLVIIAGLAGIVTCAVLMIPGLNTLSVWISQAPNEPQALRRLFGVALLAGIYTAGFFATLERVFLRMISKNVNAGQRNGK